MYVDILGEHGSVLAFNYGVFYPSRALETEDNWRVTALFMYYLNRLHQPTVQSIREGVFYLSEGGMSWENLDLTCQQRMFDEISQYDPVKFRHILVYNTNSVTNVAFSLFKPFLNQSMRKVLQLGCQIEFNLDAGNPKLSLCDIYLQPTFEAAMAKLTSRMRELLELRYANHETFRL